jgi:hypothetical protein
MLEKSTKQKYQAVLDKNIVLSVQSCFIHLLIYSATLSVA